MSQRKGSGVQQVLVNICYKKPGNKHSTLRGTHVLSVTNYFSFFVQHLKNIKAILILRTVRKRLQVKFGWKAIVLTVLKGERKNKEPEVQERVLVESGGWKRDIG